MFEFMNTALRESFDRLFNGLMQNIAALPKPVPWRSRGKGRGFNNGLLSLHRSISRQSNPAGPRKWHQSDLPDQVDRLAAAHAKRQRRAEKLSRDAHRSWDNNYAWDPRPSLNPMYVNHG